MASIELHDGEIVSTATNDHGQAESRARIIVESVEKDSSSAPTFVKDIEDQVRQDRQLKLIYSNYFQNKLKVLAKMQV